MLKSPKNSIIISSTGTRVSMVHLPRMALANIIKGVTRTPSVRITAMEKIFLPAV